MIALAKAGQKISFEEISYDKVGNIMEPDDQEQTKSITCGCYTFQIHKRERHYQRCFILSLFIIFSIGGAWTGVYRLDRLDWGPLFSRSGYILALGTFIFSLGFPFYDFVKPQGFALSNPLRVFVAAMLKRHLNQNDTQLYYHGDTDQAHQQRVSLTDRLRFLNRAAIIDPNNHDPSVEVRRWRLCSVKEVEDAKRLLVWVPMSATFILYGMIFANADTFFIQHAYDMNNSLGIMKEVPVAALYLFSRLTEWICDHLYKRFFKRFKSTRKQYLNSMKSIGLGLFTGCFCFIVAALVEAKRRKTSESLSMFWLTPNFVLMGIMEGFGRSGMEHFLYYQFPFFMKRYAVIFADTVVGLGQLLNIGFLTIVGNTKVGKSWFGTHMDYFYYVIAALGIVNFLVYVYLATRNSYRNAEIDEEEEEETEEPRGRGAYLASKNSYKNAEIAKEEEEKEGDEPRGY